MDEDQDGLGLWYTPGLIIKKKPPVIFKMPRGMTNRGHEKNPFFFFLSFLLGLDFSESV